MPLFPLHSLTPDSVAPLPTKQSPCRNTRQSSPVLLGTRPFESGARRSTWRIPILPLAHINQTQWDTQRELDQKEKKIKPRQALVCGHKQAFNDVEADARINNAD
ncbi:hypothetical protein P171DRAFT_492005 [Karstenula rhodostoma CBS 690.94]|uniref:Uncharacterized protein n=1 Tax=Karstenula rhodostoma CBS 690.94 TaxID=1392251 RepID=A0A9P4U655_9PLEO|nr:hypothetical protein P171DRAFT_492005 [Karstenula rhodostoma CBS 690.94]